MCPKTRWFLLSTSALLIRVIVSLHHVRPLLKVLGSWTRWWLLFCTLYLTITLSQSLVLDFCCPSHFILSITDVYRDTMTRDKLIFPSAITRILRHFPIPFPLSNHFPIMCAIDYATVKQSKAQFRSRRSDTAVPPIPSTPLTSALSTSTRGVTLDTIMV